MFLPSKVLERKLLRILSEDLGQGDITTALVIPERCVSEAHLIAKEPGVIAGMNEASLLLRSLGLEIKSSVSDGEEVGARSILMRITGDARTILSVERTLLNIMSRMSGIATATRRILEKLRKAQINVKIACTRKVAPGLLYFDKKAVLIGGGDTHRLHLDDMVLIKDNHIAVVGSIKKALRIAKERVTFSKKIEVEITKIEDVLFAARAGADIIMLDNFSTAQIKEAVKLLKKAKLFGKVLLEASGGVTTENILTYAATEVDVVSLGELTHSASALDISLEITMVN